MKLFIRYKFTSLNEFINQNRTTKYYGNKTKQAETNIVQLIARNHPPITEYPIKMKFTWVIKNRGKDLDNVAFAKKYILDGLTKAKVLQNDNLTKIVAFEDIAVITKDEHKQGVYIEIEKAEEQLLSPELKKKFKMI